MTDCNLTCPNCHQVNVAIASPGDTVQWTCGNCAESYYTVLSPDPSTDASDTETQLAPDVQPDPDAPPASDVPVPADDVSVGG